MIFRVIPLSVVLHGEVILQYIWMLAIVSCAILSLLFAILRPYKTNWINVWDSVVFELIAFSFFWVMCAQYIVSLPLEVIGIIAIIPLVYIVVFVIHKFTNAYRSCCVFLNLFRANQTGC